MEIAENTLYILCFKQGKLQIVNRFSISGPEDIIYYSLLCIENSGIKREYTFINIKGLYNDQLIDLIKNYFNSNKIFTQKDQSLKSFIKWESSVENLKEKESQLQKPLKLDLLQILEKKAFSTS